VEARNQFTMSHSHEYGAPVAVLKFAKDSKLLLEGSQLNSLMMHPDVKNRKAVVVSIVGAFRQGKSFFLDYCLRYLYANVSFTSSEVQENCL